MISIDKKNGQNRVDNANKYKLFNIILPIIVLFIIWINISSVNAEDYKYNYSQDFSILSESPSIANFQDERNSVNHFGNAYAFLQKNGNGDVINELGVDLISDPRTEYDTPDPDDPASISKFRVKTIPESDQQIKQRLRDNDVYSQIQQYKAQGETVFVSTPNEFVGALWGLDRPYDSTMPSWANSNPYLRNPLKNISRIVLTKDISIRQYQPVSGYQDFSDMRAVTLGNIPNRNIVIDGKDPNTGVIHRIDMCNRVTGNAGFAGTRISLENNFSSVFVMNNVKLSGVDYFGPVSAYTSTAPKQIIYRNITYVGAQLAASYSTNVTFSGYNDVKSTTEYQALEPYDTGAKDDKGNKIYDTRPGATYYAEGNVPSTAVGRVSNYYSEQIMECANVTFAYNSFLDGYTATTAPFRLGFSVSGGITPKVDVMDYAQINLESTNKGPRDEMGETGMIQLQTGTIELHPHSNVVLNAHDYVPNSSSGDIGLGNRSNVTTRDLIGLYGAGASLKVGDYASITGIQTGRVAVATTPGAVYLASGSSLDIGKWGKVSIKSINAGMSTKPVLGMGDRARITVQQPGTFDLQGDGDYAGNRSLIQLGANSIFQFNRARMVNIQYNGKQTRTNLMAMVNGKMNVKNMDAYAWKVGNTSAAGRYPDPFDNTDGSDYMWSAVYNFEANYNSAGFINLSPLTSTLYPSDLISLKANYNTNNFQRVMFRYIPTVYVKFTSQPVDDPSDVNSYKVSGETYTDNIRNPDGDYLPLPDTYVRLKGHVKNVTSAAEVGSVDLDQPFNNVIPPDSRWTLDSASDIDLASNFSVISDSQGKFTVTLPNNPTQQTFMSSDPGDLTNSKPLENGRIQAFAFKAGNYNSNDISVLDKTKPIAQSTPMKYTIVDRPVPNPKTFVDTGINPRTGLTNITDLHPEIHSNGYTKLNDYKFEFGSQNLATDTTFWTTPGVKDVYVNVFDPSNNITVVKGKVTISATPVFIEVNKPLAVLKLPVGSLNWNDAQWKSWITANNPNEAKAVKINSDGTTTDITNQMTNDAHGFGQKVNDVIYSVPTGAVPPNSLSVTSNAKIEFRSDTIHLKLPVDFSNNPKMIDFGRHGSYQVGYLNSTGTTTYPSEVIDDRINKTYNWYLEVNADNFKDQTIGSGGAAISKNSMGLGLLDVNSNAFSDIIGTNVNITEGINNKSFDIMNGLGLTNPNQKLIINRVGADSRLNGRKYNSKLVWTLIDGTP